MDEQQHDSPDDQAIADPAADAGSATPPHGDALVHAAHVPVSAEVEPHPEDETPPHGDPLTHHNAAGSRHGEPHDPHDPPVVNVADVLALDEEAPQASAELKAIVEALIFASPEPITPKMLFRMLREEPKEDVQAAIEWLKADYENRPGLMIEEVAGGYQIVTRPALAAWVRGLFHERTTQRLSPASLETLAVIAYKQPITSLEIGDIRGVNTSGVLTTLLERHLIKIVGRKNVVGRPFLYGTTREFLIRFGLKDLSELPKIEDMAEALGFDPPALLVETTPPEDVLPLEAEPEAGDPDAGTDSGTGEPSEP